MTTRIEAAAKAMVDASVKWQTTDAGELAKAALAAADAVDPLRHPDEQIVEEIATVLAAADGWLSLKHASPRHQQLLRERARTIVVALTEAG